MQGTVLALQEPDPNLKRIAALALNEVAKHSLDLAQTVIDAGAVPYLTQQINHHDAQLYKLKDADEGVRKMAASVIR